MMKTVLLLLAGWMMLPFSSLAEGAPPVVGGWKVNWERTEVSIKTVPKALQGRFASVPQFRVFLHDQVHELKLQVTADNKATVRPPPDFEIAYYTWKSGPDSRCWLQSVSTAVRHGIEPVDADRATLWFEIKTDSPGIVRIPVLIERQPVESSAAK